MQHRLGYQGYYHWQKHRWTGVFLFASTGYLNADTSFSSGLANDGTIRIIDGASTTQDALAWGDAACGNGTAAAPPAAGQSLERRPGSDLETAGNAYNTGDNNTDFLIRSTPQPQSMASPTEAPAPDYAPAPAAPGSTPIALELNELLPDPASPQTDANDEFVEIYNPNPFPVDLAGYAIKTGTNLTTRHTLQSAVVPAAGYLALKSGTTKIALANTGSSVALFDPSGHQLGPTISYPKAFTGDAWARDDSNNWSWTTTPTPGEPNVLSALDPSVLAASSSKSSATKAKSKATRSTGSKTTKAKSSKGKTTKSKALSPVPALAAATSTGGRWLLFALAGLTIAYVIYEFRYDIRNLYFQLRSYPKTGRPSGSPARGR